MAKGPRNRETRWQSSKPLDHTVSPRQRTRGPEPLSTLPLMRTVLGDSLRGVTKQAPKAPLRRSPTVVVRATGRSTDRQIKSPFLNATMFTPELTNRAMECARRHIRREVLFATKRTNGSGAKRRRSKVRC